MEHVRGCAGSRPRDGGTGARVSQQRAVVGFRMKATNMAQRFQRDKKDYPFLINAEGILERGKVTRREMTIVTLFINHHKDKPTLKIKIQKERAAAKKDEIESLLSPAVEHLMARAENGRDLGPVSDEGVGE